MLVLRFFCWDPHRCPRHHATLGNRGVFWQHGSAVPAFFPFQGCVLSSALEPVLSSSDAAVDAGESDTKLLFIHFFRRKEVVRVPTWHGGRVPSCPHAIAGSFWLGCDLGIKLNQSIQVSYTLWTLTDKRQFIWEWVCHPSDLQVSSTCYRDACLLMNLESLLW